MPIPGDQHRDVSKTANPFEEAKPRISAFTAQEIATLQSRLEKQLGPEYISSRPGAAGQKVYYVAGEKCINLANEVFGFNGWSSSIQNIQIDFVDESPTSGKISLGLSVIVRVTLRDGTFHEDVGYGHIENCKGKAAAFEKAKKEGTTDALKRALRNFGNVLGNCIYDKDYLTKVLKVKAAPPRWDVENLHRHASVAPIKKESDIKKEPEVDRGSDSTVVATDDPDEFGGSDFDEADFGETNSSESINPDEVLLSVTATSRHQECQKPMDVQSRQALNGKKEPSTVTQVVGQAVNAPTTGQKYSRPGPQQGHQQAAQQGFQQGPQRGRPTIPQQPQTPSRSPQRVFNAAAQQLRTSHPQGNPTPAQRPQQAQSHPNSNYANQQNLGVAQNQGVQSPVPHQRGQQPSNPSCGETLPQAAPQGHNPPAAFFTARAAEMLQGANAIAPSNIPTFNPHAESPSIRKTSGIDHTKSFPINRQLLGSQNGPSNAPPIVRTNFANPHLDATRKIGMPSNPSPMLNRNSYKPPGPAIAKRHSDVGGIGRSFAGSKARYAYEEFLENVDVKGLRASDEEYDEHEHKEEGEDS
ncbi:MAG: DNA repair protein rad52 [Geoglossum simile]|nr:MAG: DNA repair protein rad52 [Geoglossum simile]